MSTRPEAPRFFGRAEELRAIEDSLSDPSIDGILIEGDSGMGKTFLAREVHRRRGGSEPWLRADRVLGRTPFGVFGLLIDLNADPRDLLARIIAALTAQSARPAVFVDDVHELDFDSVRVLSQLAAEGTIRLVAMSRQIVQVGNWPFADLIDEQVIGQLALGPLAFDDLKAAIEETYGGIASQGVLDIVDQHSGRNPGKLIELLRYTKRKHRILEREGILLLDGLDLDFDDRARDFAKIDLGQFSREEREAFELVVLAGEIEVELMLSLDLGAAADHLVEVGDLLVRPRRTSGNDDQIYVARSSHASETIRYTIPIGRSRSWYRQVAERSGEPTSWSRMLRVEWGQACGAVVDERTIIDAAMSAIRFGEWHRAKRMLADVPTDRMEAPELYELASLYCNTGQSLLGLDVLAQCLRKACCPGLVLTAAVLWTNRRSLRGGSIAVSADDFRAAFDRIDDCDCCGEPAGSRPESLGMPGTAGPPMKDSSPVSPSVKKQFGAGTLTTARARELFELAVSLASTRRQPRAAQLREIALDDGLPEIFRMGIALIYGRNRLEAGQPESAAEMLGLSRRLFPGAGTWLLLAGLLEARSHLDRGESDEAGRFLEGPPSVDIAFITARSGVTDIIRGQIKLLEGDCSGALRSLRAGVAAVEHWDQTSLHATALGLAEYAATLVGEYGAADAFRSRFDALDRTGIYVEYRRALAHVLIARSIRTTDSRHEQRLREILRTAEEESSYGLVALIRFLLFRHLGETDAAEMIRVSELGHGRNFDFLGAVGTALRSRSVGALAALAQQERNSDLTERCRSLGAQLVDPKVGAASPHTAVGPTADLTERERQISRFIVLGMSNAEIAAELGVRQRTVEGHTYRLFKKLGIARRHEVAEVVGEAVSGVGPAGDAPS